MSLLPASTNILNWYAASNTIMAACPIIYYKEIPEFDTNGQPIRPPFCVLKIPKEEPQFTTEPNRYDLVTAVFTIYAMSTAQCDTIASAISTQFDGQGFNQCSNITNTGDNDDIRDRDGNIVPHRELTYEMIILRTGVN